MLTRAAFALVLVLSASTSACGSRSKSADAVPAAQQPPAAGGHEGHEGHEGGEHAHAHGADGSALHKFHEQLAPLWHAPESPQRVTDTCNAAAGLHGLAGEIVKAGPPAGAPADYADTAKKLEAAVATLHDECGTPERKDFAAKFAAVHDAFHALAERTPH
jgi:hypothetical protein